MKKIILGLFIFGLTTQFFAQTMDNTLLPGVVLHNVNYKYLSNVSVNDESETVGLLEYKAADFDLKTLTCYKDEDSEYEVYFCIPDGFILATYDNDGTVTRTVEKFKNTTLPIPVINSINERFPGWGISKNTYKVTYNQETGVKKTYKFTLENGDELIRVKTDSKGNFI